MLKNDRWVAAMPCAAHSTSRPSWRGTMPPSPRGKPKTTLPSSSTPSQHSCPRTMPPARPVPHERKSPAATSPLKFALLAPYMADASPSFTSNVAHSGATERRSRKPSTNTSSRRARSGNAGSGATPLKAGGMPTRCPARVHPAALKPRPQTNSRPVSPGASSTACAASTRHSKWRSCVSKAAGSTYSRPDSVGRHQRDTYVLRTFPLQSTTADLTSERPKSTPTYTHRAWSSSRTEAFATTRPLNGSALNSVGTASACARTTFNAPNCSRFAATFLFCSNALKICA
mmetsp:Transcript_16745/g.45768  ORF Transcript_16745/g.45768 Transcript_16745/m.45768 type:complete len:287 (+) Transcript_16745:512-1372(+)